MDLFDLQEIMTGLELGRGEGYGGTTANTMSGDLPDAVGDVMQMGSDSRTEARCQKKNQKNRREQCFGRGDLQATLESAAVSWAWRIARSDCAASSSAARN